MAPRRVLACFECNQKRQIEETNMLPAHIRVAIGKGYSLNPRGKGLFHKTAESVEQVYERLEKEGIEIIRFDEAERAFKTVPNTKINLNPLVDKLPEIV